MIRTTLCSALLMLASAAALPAQVKVEIKPDTAAHSGTTYRAKQLLGSKVMIQGNTAVGTVDDIVFDDAGNLEYLIVNNDGKMVTVPWEATKYSTESKMATLNLTAQQYQTIPTYTSTTYPAFYTPEYRTQVYKYYGLTPRELRRLRR